MTLGTKFVAVLLAAILTAAASAQPSSIAFVNVSVVRMHVHFAVTGNTAQDTAENERLAEAFLAHGITTVRSMNGSPGILSLRRRIDAGEVRGPRIFTTGPINGLSRTVTHRPEDPTIRAVPQRLRDAWAADADNDRTDPAAGLLDFGLALAKRLHDAGVGLLLGSDDMNPYIVPGVSLHEELALLVKAGFASIGAFGCASCGYLELYAGVEFASKEVAFAEK